MSNQDSELAIAFLDIADPPTSSNLRLKIKQSSGTFLAVFLPFAAGYYLSYFFRIINAVISSELVAEFSLGAVALGLLTSVYFLSALVQIPIGVMVDRLGPRRVQSGLLLVAAIGATVFACGQEIWMLIVGRALIGLGAGAAVVSGFKAIAIWYPRERLAFMNGCFVMVGALGALTATAPADSLLALLGWRGLIGTFAIATAACSVGTFLLVPEAAIQGSRKINVRLVMQDRRFWRLAPLSTMCIGTAWALQGLWAAPWMQDVENLERTAIVSHLFVMAISLSAGAFFLGAGAHLLRKCGIRAQEVLSIATALCVTAEIMLILGHPMSSYFLWAIVASLGGASVLTYAILADYFSEEMIGQANAILSTCHITGAFILQYATGFVIDRWAGQGGHYPPIAYQTAFSIIVLLQIAALVWFAAPRFLNAKSAARGLQEADRAAALSDPLAIASLPPERRKALFAHLLEALHDARRIKAAREIRRYRHLLADETPRVRPAKNASTA
jgi:MFS family permease